MLTTPGPLKLHEPRNQDQQPSWFCDLCQHESSGPRLIYGVSLCFLCIPQVAEYSHYAHHFQAKAYMLQQEVAMLRRVNANLRQRLANAEGTDEQ